MVSGLVVAPESTVGKVSGAGVGVTFSTGAGSAAFSSVAESPLLHPINSTAASKMVAAK